ncbi:hypothetical protein ACOTTU_21800 [Roseobacter sp. EG26]|uniref:hypothetical protein n=1 Tax=Roseobacter sp. EG26 TaxID=3412477 RepID=UPI0026214F4F|nr:hypothetical protein [uncultured Roseobacter sp.]
MAMTLAAVIGAPLCRARLQDDPGHLARALFVTAPHVIPDTRHLAHPFTHEETQWMSLKPSPRG